MDTGKTADLAETVAVEASDTEPGPDKAYGLWVPALTPLDEALVPDPKRFVAHAKALLEQGCHGIGIFGTTGEATSFSVDERIALMEAALEAGLPAAQLMIGTGCCALSDTLALTKRAVELGCTRVLMLPPFYYKGPSDEGLAASYSEVIERVGNADLQIYLYHFPRLSGVPITHGLIERLRAAYPRTIAGVKDSSGDADGTAAYLSAFPDLAIFPGTETLMLPMLEKGGAGSITASANVNARAIRRVYDAWAAGDPEKTALQARITEIREVLQANPLIPALKHIVAQETGDPGWRRIRPPLMPLSDAAAQALTKNLADHSFVFGGA